MGRLLEKGKMPLLRGKRGTSNDYFYLYGKYAIDSYVGFEGNNGEQVMRIINGLVGSRLRPQGG